MERRYYLRYRMNGELRETDELLSKANALMEKAEFETDGAKDVELVPYVHLVFQS